MKIYVASSWRNDFQPGVVAALRGDGHSVYDFKGPGDGWGLDGDGPGGFAWSEVDPEWQSWSSDIPRYLEGLRHPRAVEGYWRDMAALNDSDACVMVAPCGPSASMEMGWAAGSGRYVAVYMPGIREPDLMVKMADHIGTDLTEIRRRIIAYADRRRSAEQRAVTRWFEANGGHSNALNATKRIAKELFELLDAMGKGDMEHAREEAADVALCLLLASEYAGFDLMDAIRWKQGINEQRRWTVDGLGCLSHVKGSDPRDVKALDTASLSQDSARAK